MLQIKNFMLTRLLVNRFLINIAYMKIWVQLTFVLVHLRKVQQYMAHQYNQCKKVSLEPCNMLLPWIFLIIATKESQLEKHCHQSVLKHRQLAVFRRAPDIFFRWLKTLWWTHVIEYLLLAMWPISLFYIYAIYWSQT